MIMLLSNGLFRKNNYYSRIMIIASGFERERLINDNLKLPNKLRLLQSFKEFVS